MSTLRSHIFSVESAINSLIARMGPCVYVGTLDVSPSMLSYQYNELFSDPEYEFSDTLSVSGLVLPAWARGKVDFNNEFPYRLDVLCEHSDIELYRRSPGLVLLSFYHRDSELVHVRIDTNSYRYLDSHTKIHWDSDPARA